MEQNLNKSVLSGTHVLVGRFILFLIIAVLCPVAIVLLLVLVAIGIPAVIFKILFVDMVRVLKGGPEPPTFSLFNFGRFGKEVIKSHEAKKRSNDGRQIVKSAYVRVEEN